MIRFTFSNAELPELEVDLLGVGVFEGQLAQSREVEQLDKALDRHLSRLVAQQKFEGKEDQCLELVTLGHVKPERIVLLGLGRREEFDVPDSRRYGAALVAAARSAGAKTVAAALPPIDSLAAERGSQFLAEGVLLAAYSYERFLSEERRRPLKLEEFQLALPQDFRGSAPHLSVARAEVVGRAVCLARDLTNEPPSELTPARLADVATGIAKERGLECRVLGPKEIERQKMRLLLAVARGSTEEPRFIHLTYRPKGKEKASKRIVVVGKGVTFDSGGLSLKPTTSMVDMKCDMAGAAVVLAAMSGLGDLGFKSEVHGLVAATENMPGSSAYKLGDVVVGMAGKSVEVVNTDAEGRLTLADALAYGVKLKPDAIIDVATLTGACMVALGPHVGGVMGNDVSEEEQVVAAARRAGEEMWRLPLPRRLKGQLESPIADLKNAGERWGGALTAGLFLKEFVGDIPWVHIDIAGPAFAEKPWAHVPRGGTGFGVPTLFEYLGGRDSGNPS